QLDQVVESPDRGVEGAGRGERADVQLVDHRAGKVVAGPPGVLPREVVGVEPARLVRAVRLPPGPRVGQRLLVVVQQETVVAARQRLCYVCPPPAIRPRFEICCAASPPGHPRVMHGRAGFVWFGYRDPHPGGPGRPYADLWHQDSSASNSATGYWPRASATHTLPVWREPVNTSRYRPGGRVRPASPQPPLADRPAGSRVASVIAPPRSKATRCSRAGPPASSGA